MGPQSKEHIVVKYNRGRFLEKVQSVIWIAGRVLGGHSWQGTARVKAGNSRRSLGGDSEETDLSYLIIS